MYSVYPSHYPECSNIILHNIILHYITMIFCNLHCIPNIYCISRNISWYLINSESERNHSWESNGQDSNYHRSLIRPIWLVFGLGQRLWVETSCDWVFTNSCVWFIKWNFTLLVLTTTYEHHTHMYATASYPHVCYSIIPTCMLQQHPHVSVKAQIWLVQGIDGRLPSPHTNMPPTGVLTCSEPLPR